MATIINKKDILSIVKSVDVITAMETGFIKYSNGETVVPPVAELLFDNPSGDTHIKYGYIKNDKYYCIKIASGFYENPKLGISSSQGMMLLFNQKTGEPVSILLDGGELTNIRTAAAGALAARYFAPSVVKGIGLIGTGIQGKLQLLYLREITSCRKVWIWDINKDNALRYKEELGSEFDIEIASTPSDLARKCKLIVTTTPSEIALIEASDVMEGTHITAVGSDTATKQELSGSILAKADIVIADSIEQSKSRGEIFRAVREGAIRHENVTELGYALQNKSYQRSNDNQITVVDLTGVAVQDIMIATAVYNKYKQ
jgi:ornithine cyclodeaminase